MKPDDDFKIYNTTTPDDFSNIEPLPQELIPDEDIGVTREKQMLFFDEETDQLPLKEEDIIDPDVEEEDNDEEMPY